MLKPSTMIWMLVWVSLFSGLYMVKYRVQNLKREVAAAERELRDEKKMLRVLEAEWTYLSRPSRLASLSEKYLADNEALGGAQLADIASLPLDRPADVIQQAAARVAGEKVKDKKSVALAVGAAHGR